MAGWAGVWALAAKDLRLLLRDRGALFLTFLWPLILAGFFGALGPGFGAALEESDAGAGKMVVLIVDEDGGAEAKALRAALEEHPRISLEAAELARAEERVGAGEVPAYVHLAPGFADGRSVELGVDPRRAGEAELLSGALELAAYQARDPQPALTIARRSITGEGASARPPSPYAVTFPQGVIWAVLACAATFAVSLVHEHDRGTLLRLAVAPLPRWQILAGKGLACLLAILVMAAVLIAAAVLGFGVRPLSWPLLLVAVLATGLGFVGVMTLLAALGRRTASTAGLSWAVLMAMAMVGGGMLPLFLMPPWLQQVAWLSPVSWALRAIEGAVWRGSSLAEIGGACLALLLLGAVSLGFGARTVREL
ncbi:MAG: ABC transporter permease [Myxococcales bacterium]|nr:ABC transporter permease [Myxococcales bacterium]